MKQLIRIENSLTLIVAVAAILSLCLTQSSLADSPTAWGRNVNGECNAPTDSGFVAIAAGTQHSLALRADGSIAAWGLNAYGQCSNIPGGAYKIGNVWYSNSADFVAVAGGGDFSLALTADGSLVAWGRNNYGQCDVPTDTDFVAVVASHGLFSLALKANGSIAAWSRNDFGQCSNIPGGAYKIGNVWYSNSNDFVAVAGGAYHSLALKADGSLVAWGRNSHGQCDMPAGTDFIAVAGGDWYSLALKADGSLVTRGSNTYGQCDVPEDNDFVAIAAGGDHGLALKADGSLAAWGSNAYDQCSNITGGSYEINNVWYSNSADFVTVAACNQQSLALTSTNTPPVAICQDVIVSADEYGQGYVTVDDVDNGSYDPDGDSITLSLDPAGPYQLGDTVVTLTVTDDKEASDQCTATVTVIDNTPPEILLDEPFPSVLWPPNHKFVDVMIIGMTQDNCDTELDIDVLVNVLDVEGGDGGSKHDPDYYVVGGIIDEDGFIEILVSLRAERSGKGDDRIYEIIVEVMDDAGNIAAATVDVTVPHDQGKGKKGKK